MFIQTTLFGFHRDRNKKIQSQMHPFLWLCAEKKWPSTHPYHCRKESSCSNKRLGFQSGGVDPVCFLRFCPATWFQPFQRRWISNKFASFHASLLETQSTEDPSQALEEELRRGNDPPTHHKETKSIHGTMGCPQFYPESFCP